jgi:hypothetical protein
VSLYWKILVEEKKVKGKDFTEEIVRLERIVPDRIPKP